MCPALGGVSPLEGGEMYDSGLCGVCGGFSQDAVCSVCSREMAASWWAEPTCAEQAAALVLVRECIELADELAEGGV